MMPDKPLLSPTLTASILDMIRYAEEQWQITITIHDLKGVFDSLDSTAISRKYAHHHPFCGIARSESDDRCMRDCRIRCNDLAEKKGAPFVFDCWKGGREVVVPLMQDGMHVATVFAGVFRGTAEPPTAALQAAHTALPALEEPERLATVLHFLAQGMLHQLTEAREAEYARGDRKGMIQRHIRLHAHTPVSLKDLADHLALSPSHTSHLVSQLFGVSFQQLLVQERIRRARGLLRTTGFSLAMIAERTGFSSVFYFSRQFRRITGMPPGQFRTQNHSAHPQTEAP